MNIDIKKKLSEIKILGIDIDGVLTDGKLYYGPDGENLKVFHARDGLGISMLYHQTDIIPLIISGRESKIARVRLQEIGVPNSHIFMQSMNKKNILEKFLSEHPCSKEHIAFIGDDVIDIKIMACVGLSITVADAHADVKKQADLITKCVGGGGAVREVVDYIFQAKNITCMYG